MKKDEQKKILTIKDIYRLAKQAYDNSKKKNSILLPYGGDI
jgi:hypothetical protein